MTGIYSNLTAQLDKLRKHNRQGSIKTKARYYEAMKRFCRFLAEEYRLEKLANIAPKHLHSYTDHLKESGKAPSTIKTDLAAIRFWHDKISAPRHKLPSNEAFDLERRTTGNLDRTWSDDEFDKMLQIAKGNNRTDYATALHLAYHAGLRIEECFTLDTAMSEYALRSGAITFHGKNGRWRTVPIDENIAKVLQKRLTQVKRGSKLLTPDDMTVENAIHNFQGFIERHRGMVESPNRQTPLTAHGLRHSYACRQYLNFLDKGNSQDHALRKVSRLLGHNRPGVVRVYLAGVLDGGDGDV